MMLEKVKVILADNCFLEEDEINEDTNLRSDLELEDIDIIEIFAELEDELSISITEEDMEKIETVRDLANFIERNKK